MLFYRIWNSFWVRVSVFFKIVLPFWVIYFCCHREIYKKKLYAFGKNNCKIIERARYGCIPNLGIQRGPSAHEFKINLSKNKVLLLSLHEEVKYTSKSDIYTIVSMKEINCMDNYVWWRLFLSSNILHKKTMHSFSVLLHTSRNLLYTFAGKESCRTSIEIPEYSQMFLSYETLFVVVKSGYFCAWQELWEGLFCDLRRRNAMIWATHQGLFLWTIPITPQEAFNYRETHLKPRE